MVATTAPASRPPVVPTSRPAVNALTAAAAVAAMAFGRMTAAGEKPNRRTARAGIQKEPGILSSDTVPAGSKAPKKRFDQLLLIDMATAP